MMKTISRHAWATICLMCTALLLSTAFIACSDSNDTGEKQDSATPVNPDDWQTVPAAGGTIKKGSIAITFPSGTFDKDEKVAITEINKGKVGGEHEASPFYQITMPCTVGKPLTVKIKSKEQNNDLAFVAYADAFCMSSGTEKKAELTYNTTYSDGIYSATIPAINGDAEGENVAFTIGLGHKISYAGAKTRAIMSEVLQEGKVGTVTYIVRFPWWTLCTYDDDTLVKLEMKSKDIAEYAKEALTEIFKLGFKVDGEKTLYIDFEKNKDWGGHQVCGVPGEGGWSMWVSLGIEKLFDKDTTEQDIKGTIIHEILHWVHAISYDPRSNYKKSKKQYGGEEMVMYEMGAVWAEQFLNDGKMNAKFVSDFLDAFLGGAIDPNNARRNYAEHGYGMSALLYYITKTPMIKKEKVVDMYDIWNVDGMADKSFQPFKQWLEQNHCKILDADKFYEFVFKLYSGKVIEDNDHEYINPRTLSLATIKNMALKNDEKIIQKANCSGYGIATRRFHAYYYKNEKGENSFKDKEIVFKQTEPDVMTFVIACAGEKENVYKVFDKKIAPGDSLVINGNAADALFETGTPYSFVVVSVNVTDTKKPANITCEIRNSIPQNIFMVYLGGSIKTNRTYKTYGGKYKTDTYPYSPWASLKPANNTKITSSLSGSTLHVDATSTNDHQLAEYDYASYQISFDVKNFKPNYKNCELVNLTAKVNRNGKASRETSNSEYKIEWGLKASVVPLDRVLYIPNDTSYATFKAYVKDGLVIDSYYYNGETKLTSNNGWIISDENIVNESCTYADDPNNHLEIRFEFKQ